MDSLKLIHPSTCLISGPTGSGKTYFVKKLIDYEMFDPMPPTIVYCYGSYQLLFQSMRNVQFEDGLPPSIGSLRNALVIIDDLMCELANNSQLSRLFTKGSHHRNLSVIFITQNLFHQGKEMRNIHLNSHYMVLFKNPRDKSQIMHLAKQMYPGKSKSFQQAFLDATLPEFGYLFIDLRPETNDVCRLRTHIFDADKCVIHEPR